MAILLSSLSYSEDLGHAEFYSFNDGLPEIICWLLLDEYRVPKLLSMRWTGCVARVGDMTNY